MMNLEKEPFELLEDRISDLILLANKLSNENQELRTERKKWIMERAELTKKNELAKSKLESVLSRLKRMR